MRTISAQQAQSSLDRLLEEVARTSESVQIQGATGSVVLVSEADWRAIQETLHLLSIPGMRGSLLEGKDTPLSECSESLSW